MPIIDIAIPFEELGRRRARLAAALEFKCLERVPVLPGIYSRYWLHRLSLTWAQYVSDPVIMLETQLRAHKLILESFDSDLTGLDPKPDLFSIYGEAYGFGCELNYDELSPWIGAHAICDERDLRRLDKIDPTDNRYTDALRRWMARMELHLGDYRLRYADGVVRSLPEKLAFPGGTLGIFTLATDLRGPDIYVDLYERPAFVHEFLQVVTNHVIARLHWLRGMGIGLTEGTYLIDDSAGALSPRHYRTFVLPYNLQVLEAIGRPLRIHVDAPADHLLPIYREIGLDRLEHFGWATSLEKVRECLGGRTVISGNIDPALFVTGTPDEVYAASLHALNILAPCGGYILQDGYNMPPGAKDENITAMLRAAEDFGLPTQSGVTPAV
jgi:hypothetical protein